MTPDELKQVREAIDEAWDRLEGCGYPETRRKLQAALALLSAPDATPDECPVCHTLKVQAGVEFCHKHAPDATEGWMPIETAPKDGTEFITMRFLKDGRPAWKEPKTQHWIQESQGLSFPKHGGIYFVPATHWQPLPQPPQALATPKDSHTDKEPK